jgi:DNA replication ATP-dependent helicase Dna2
MHTNDKTFLAATRYKVVKVWNVRDEFTKIVSVTPWRRKPNTDGGIFDGEEATEDVRANDSNTSFLYLRGDWYDSPVRYDDTLNIVSPSNQFLTTFDSLPLVLHTSPPHLSTPDDLLLILHPDRIIAPSYISEHTQCKRRAVVKNKLKGAAFSKNRSAALGDFRHRYFQSGMEGKDISEKSMLGFARDIVKSNTETIIATDMTEDETIVEITNTRPQIDKFCDTYAGFVNDVAPAKRPGQLLKGVTPREDVFFQATGVFAIEEEAFLPDLGMKGFVDVTLEAELTSSNPTFDGNKKTCLFPLELKTGHKQEVRNQHTAQLSLYTLLLQAVHGRVSKKSYQSTSGAGIKTGANAGLLSPETVSTDTSSEAPPPTPMETVLQTSYTPGARRSWQKGAVSNFGAGTGGMLLYLNDKGFEARHVKPDIAELKTLFSIRNEFSYNLKLAEKPRGVGEALDVGATVLPKIDTPVGLCKNCFSNTECMLYRRVEMEVGGNVDDGGAEHGEMIKGFTAHLSSVHLQYFHEWDRMLDLELSETNVNIVKTWLVPAIEREANTGRTIANMVWKNYRQELNYHNNKTTYVVLHFERSQRLTLPTPLSQREKRYSLTNLLVDVGNRVVVSSDHFITSEGTERSGTRRQQLHIVKGDVVKITDASISIKCALNEYERMSNLHAAWGEKEGNALRFRLDVDEYATSGGALRQNLIDLCKNKSEMEWLRKMVVDCEAPKFKDVDSSRMFTGSADGRPHGVHGCDMDSLMMEFYDLNVDQQNAVNKIVHAEDYTIIQGLPGTGKTSTVAYVVRLLVARGLRVLVTSYTHAAVDNLLLNLKGYGVGTGEGMGDMLRIGSEFSVHKDCLDLMPKKIASDMYGVVSEDDVDDTGDSSAANDVVVSSDVLMRVMQDAKVVGVTSLTAPKSPLLTGQSFDVVIVDEAGQITQPAILGSLAKANMFVLVGDHMQLPPLVRDTTAKDAGYDVSLLRRLAENVPSSVAQLALQYRMHEDIVYLCNIIAYEGALKCGNEQVRTGIITYGDGKKGWVQREPVKSGGLMATIHGLKKDWLATCLKEENVVTFLDTDNLGLDLEKFGANNSGRKQRGTSNLVNPTETELVRGIVKALHESCEFDLKDVGVISHYRSQVRALRSDEYLLECIDDKRLEVATIDTYQGRDKRVIIVSFVRSNEEGSGGELLRDFRRINVAISRAKVKLVLIGSRKTLAKGSECMASLLKGMDVRGWIHEVKEKKKEEKEGMDALGLLAE